MDVILKMLRYANVYSITLFVYSFIACWKQEKRKLFYLRLIPAILVCAFVSSDFYRELMKFGVIPDVGGIRTFPYVIIWLLNVLCVWCCFKIDILKAFLFQSIAYVFEHTIFNFRYVILIDRIENQLIYYLLMLLIKSIVGVIIWFTVTGKLNRLEYLFKYKIIVALLSCVNILIALFVNNIFYNQGWFSQAMHFLYIALCIVFIYLPFIVNRLIRDNDEKQKLEYMLAVNNEQRRNSKENIESINRKCHDLKHQIIMLRETSSAEEFKEVLSSLERDVIFYDANLDTGNKSIDILIKEKGLLCNDYNIDFTYVIDGARLDFMHKVDLYTMLGNALDNAIEAARQVPEGKRVILLNVSGKDGITKLIMQNSVLNLPEIVDGLPQTTKPDKFNHGFGVKSIKMIAEKYGGQVDFNIEEGRFSLTILFFNDNLGNN